MHLKFEDGTTLRVRQPEHVEPVSILTGVGAHRLLMRMEVETVQLAEGCNQVQLTGDLFAEHAGRNRWIGALQTVTVLLSLDGYGRPADLVVPVTDAQILALEKDRNGQDLQLRVDLRGALPQSRKYPLKEEQETRRVPASRWEHQIQQLGRALSFTVTVPLPMDDGPLADIAGHVRAADQQITKGEFLDAIREARLAIDMMRDQKVWPSRVTKRRDDQTPADRYGVILDKLTTHADGYADLLQALFNQASGPQHTGGGMLGAIWARADAVALTTMAAGMLHRVAEEIGR